MQKCGMSKFKMSEIKTMAATYYAIGMVVFSGAFVVLAVIVYLVNRNS